ncbi:hypothetical protein [Daejeonella sp. H1SJ63]|uniref:hypothetical protein n=1 Tax=Daejeonella sp. H1SJ63 TaxID=3034145 RepID=UPI0023EB23E5|nr:hypothetical protein [Daejeonella sp. H1SJ63]
MMNKKEILKKVGDIISELNDQYEYLSANPENLNDLELELFAANSEFLSNHISILIKLNDNSVSSKADNHVAAQQAEPAVPQFLNPVSADPAKNPEEAAQIPDWKSQLAEEVRDSFDYEEKNANELFDRPLTEEEIRVIDEKTRLKTVVSTVHSDIESLQHVISDEPLNVEETTLVAASESVLVPVSSSEPPLLPVTEVKGSELPTASSAEAPLSLNDILSAQTSRTTVSSQLNQKQPKDLKSMISLNDKLLFVRDLFNGYSLAYSEAIELLNRFDNFESADNFLKQNYASKNSWSDKQAAVDKFYELLSKRFSN